MSATFAGGALRRPHHAGRGLRRARRWSAGGAASVTVHLLSAAGLAPLMGRGRLLRKGKRMAVAEGEVATVQFALVTPSA